jgi:hypothetical protein
MSHNIRGRIERLEQRRVDPGNGNTLCPRFWECFVIRREHGREFRVGCGENASSCTLPADSGFRRLCQPYSLTPEEQRQLEDARG